MLVSRYSFTLANFLASFCNVCQSLGKLSAGSMGEGIRQFSLEFHSLSLSFQTVASVACWCPTDFAKRDTEHPSSQFYRLGLSSLLPPLAQHREIFLTVQDWVALLNLARSAWLRSSAIASDYLRKTLAVKFCPFAFLLSHTIYVNVKCFRSKQTLQ